MATIYNNDLFEEIRRGAKIQQLRDSIPTQLAEKVVPVMEVNPRLLKRCDKIIFGNSGGSFSLVVPALKDFYLTALQVAYNEIVTDTLSLIVVTCVQSGVTAQRICLIPTSTLTVAQGHFYYTFPNPIKIDRGTSIAITATGTVTGMWVSAIGYLDDYSIA